MNAVTATQSERWTATTLGKIVGERGKTVNPANAPQQNYELYSVPRFPTGEPEIAAGSEIGSSKQLVEPKSVLLCKINPRINRAWVVGDFTAHTKIASTEWMVFPPRREIAPEFLCYFLQQNSLRDFLARNASGVGGSLMRVKPTTLREFPFAYPRLEEQKRIVAEIEKQFTRLDAGVAALRRVQANLKRYRAAVLKGACEGRLVPTEAELAKAEGRTYETGEQLLARILADRRKNWHGRGKYNEPTAPDVTNLPQLPEGWVPTTFGACFHVAVGATPSRKEPSYWNGDIPWVSSGEVHFNGIASTRESITSSGLGNSSTHLNPKGSVLLGMIGEGKTRGQTAILKIDACNNQNCAAIWVSRTQIPPEYVFYWLWSQYENTRRTSSGNNQPALNKARVEGMFIPLPPLAEQARIVAEVERRLSVIEEMEAAVATDLQRATCLRQSILQRNFAV